jgi:hypothetical protein
MDSDKRQEFRNYVLGQIRTRKKFDMNTFLACYELYEKINRPGWGEKLLLRYVYYHMPEDIIKAALAEHGIQT